MTVQLVLCICTCGRPAGLERVLGAVDALVWPEGEMPSFAVVVVDNLPDGRARDVVERLRPAFRWPLHFVEEPQPGWTVARNRAVAEALSLGAEFVAFVDDDDLPRPDWLWWLWQRQRETGADIVFGAQLRVPEGEEIDLSTIENVEGADELGPFGFPARVGDGNVMYGRLIIKKVLDAYGVLYTDDFRFSGGEDTYLFLKMMRHGAYWAMASKSIVMVKRHYNVKSAMMRSFREGFVNTRLQMIFGYRLISKRRMLVKITKHFFRIIGIVPKKKSDREEWVGMAYELGCLRAYLPGTIRQYR